MTTALAPASQSGITLIDAPGTIAAFTSALTGNIREFSSSRDAHVLVSV